MVDTSQQAQVRLIVDLFDDINFAGSRRTLVRDLADFRLIDFNDRTSSVRVTAGPNFRTGDAARLFTDINFAGASITLPPGEYPDLRVQNFNDVASSAQIVSAVVPPPGQIVAEDQQRETLQFNLRIVTPVGTSLVSVQNNRILNPTATGTFVGDTGVLVNGSFIDEIVAIIRDTSTGVTRQATGRVTIPFNKTINFPQIAGINKNTLEIRVSITNITQSFTLTGNILSKTVQMDITTQVIRRTLTSENPTQIAAIESGNYIVTLS